MKDYILIIIYLAWDCVLGDYNVWKGWSLPTHMGVPDVWRLEDVSSSAECAHHCTEKPECQAWSYHAYYNGGMEYRYVQCNLLSEVYAFAPFGAKDQSLKYFFKPKLRFFTKISILHQNSNFSPKFQFFTKISIFHQKSNV